MTVLEIKTHKRNVLINITAQVREAVKKSGVAEGSAMVYCPHTTAGICINENADPDVAADIVAGLEAMVPNIGFRHGEGNSDAHIKTALVGTSAGIPVTGGELALGMWQAVYFCEFDGPRNRKYYVSVNKQD